MGAFGSTPSVVSGERFIEAIRLGCVEEVKEYLLKGGDINYKTESSSISSNNSFIGEGETGLQVASRDNKLKIVRILMQHDCDLNILDEFNNTAVMDGSKNGHIDIVRILVAGKKCHLNYRNNSGYTAVMRACICQHLDVVKVLIDYGADISIADNFGRKPLNVLLSNEDRVAVEEYYKIHSPLTPWNRRKNMLIVLKENGYRPPCLNQDLRYLQVFSDDNLLRIIISYL